MTRDTWRYLDLGALPGAWNMAIDEAMLQAHALQDAPPTLRVYAWRPPAISLGRFQQLDTSVRSEQCRDAGVDVVRRPTGGRAILHTEEEVTFSIVVSEERLGTRGVMDSYRLLAGGIVAGLNALGLEARLVERPSSGAGATPHGAPDPVCFAAKARCDLVVGSNKLVGSAQVHRDGVILQQNSLPLRIRPQEWSRFFVRQARDAAAIGLWDAARRELPRETIAGALRQGFEEALGVALVDGALTQREQERAAQLAHSVDLLPRQPTP